MRAIAATLPLLAFPIVAPAHHSVAGFFDPNRQIEIEGIVTATSWRNPHVIFEIDVAESSGGVTSWTVESGGLGIFQARGLDRAFLRVGDDVTFLGDASLRGRSEMFARNLLLDGKEVLLTISSRRYFSLREDGQLLESAYDEEIEQAARRDADGIFRVWSADFDEKPASAFTLFGGDYPLSSEAEAIRSEWDPSDSSLLGCPEWSMPRLMNNPLPIEFVRQGDDILLRAEEHDSERLIHMNPNPARVPGVHSLLGYSTGRWDHDSLIVETTEIAANRLDGRGTPHSASIRLLERFTPTSDGSRLDYRVTITDPNTFTEPFDAERYWIWRPEIVVRRYACGEERQLRE
jgi:hypothetical protein